MTPVSLYNTACRPKLGKFVQERFVHLVSALSDRAFDAKRVAAEFVTARRSAGTFENYPGALPPDLDAAYRCQDEAISLWDDTIAGWKVGWIPEPFSRQFGTQRLVGPIFSRGMRRANGGGSVEVPVFARGFAAIEAEFVLRISRDAPANVVDWTAETARRFVDAMFTGIEIASSPLQNINDYGPAVVASDFGNNAGLLLGAEVPGWQTRSLELLHCETRVEDEVMGLGNAAAVSGGPLAGLAFALRCNARRGRPLRAGDFVTTGAITGVHAIAPGQSAEVHFAGIGILRCRAVPMTPVA